MTRTARGVDGAPQRPKWWVTVGVWPTLHRTVPNPLPQLQQ